MVWRRRGEKRRREEGGREAKEEGLSRCKLGYFTHTLYSEHNPLPCCGFCVQRRAWANQGPSIRCSRVELGTDCLRAPPTLTNRGNMATNEGEAALVCRSGDDVIGLGKYAAGLYAVLASRYQAFSGMADDSMLINGRA